MTPQPPRPQTRDPFVKFSTHTCCSSSCIYIQVCSLCACVLLSVFELFYILTFFFFSLVVVVSLPRVCVRVCTCAFFWGASKFRLPCLRFHVDSAVFISNVLEPYGNVRIRGPSACPLECPAIDEGEKLEEILEKGNVRSFARHRTAKTEAILGDFEEPLVLYGRHFVCTTGPR